MYRSESFQELFEYFNDTLGQEEGLITIYELQTIGDYGLQGKELKEKCMIQGITLICPPPEEIDTTKGQLSNQLHASLRTTTDNLENCFFFKNKKRFKIIKKLPVNGQFNNNEWLHYECIEG